MFGSHEDGINSYYLVRIYAKSYVLVHILMEVSQIFVVKDRFNLDGVELKTSIKEPGYKLYDLKIYKEIYLEDHDNFRCKNYANFGDYNSVRVELMTTQIWAASVCTQIVSKYVGIGNHSRKCLA